MTSSHRNEASLYIRDPIPARAGIGLRHVHLPDFLTSSPAIPWLEIHSENYLIPGGPRLHALEAIRRDYPLSCHSVGLSLGSAEGLDENHLQRLKVFYDRFQPDLISEHVSWSVTGGIYLNDLLALPYTDEALDVICSNVDRAQTRFSRRILVENPSSYVTFSHSTMPECEFMAEITRRTGAGLLLDVNNIHVSATNHGFDPHEYLTAIPAAAVEEIHLAGHFVRDIGGETLLIDDHGTAVDDAVWRLYEHALARLGPIPTLIEWDTNIPPLTVLLAEAHRAEVYLGAARRRDEARHAA